MLAAYALHRSGGGALLALGLVHPCLGLLGLAGLLRGRGAVGQPRLELGNGGGALLQAFPVAVVQRLAASLVVGIQAALFFVMGFTAALFLVAQRIDQPLDLLAVACLQVAELDQPGIQARAALARHTLDLLEVVVQLLALLAPLGQRGEVAFEPRHVGLGVGFEAALQVVEVAACLVQHAVEFADPRIKAATRLLMGLLKGLEAALAFVQLRFEIGAGALGAMAVGLELGPQLPQRRLEFGGFPVEALEDSRARCNGSRRFD